MVRTSSKTGEQGLPGPESFRCGRFTVGFISTRDAGSDSGSFPLQISSCTPSPKGVGTGKREVTPDVNKRRISRFVSPYSLLGSALYLHSVQVYPL